MGKNGYRHLQKASQKCFNEQKNHHFAHHLPIISCLFQRPRLDRRLPGRRRRGRRRGAVPLHHRRGAGVLGAVGDHAAQAVGEALGADVAWKKGEISLVNSWDFYGILWWFMIDLWLMGFLMVIL